MTVLAVERLGQNPGGGGFSSPSWAREQIGVSHPTFGHFPSKGGGDMTLADHLVKCLRPVLPVKSLILQDTATVHPCGDAFTALNPVCEPFCGLSRQNGSQNVSLTGDCRRYLLS